MLKWTGEGTPTGRRDSVGEFEQCVGTPIEALVDEGQKRDKAPRASMISIAGHCATVIRWRRLQAVAPCSYITVKASA
jgi:hypothetical protein